MTAKDKLADSIRGLPHLREYFRRSTAVSIAPPDVQVWLDLLAAIPDAPPEPCAADKAFLEDDQRKLRIMRAMEDTAKKGAVQFVFEEGVWSVKTQLGFWPINDMYSPEPPLWEGEIQVNPNTPSIVQGNFPLHGYGWRKIKVREVR